MKALATAFMVTATLVGMSVAHADGKTREQVQQEPRAAKVAGQVISGEQASSPRAAAPQTVGKTREQVREELAQAKARGEYTFGELDYPPKGR